MDCKKLIVLIALGFLGLNLTGCRRKEDEPDPERPDDDQVEERVEAPDNFHTIPGTDPPVFLSKSPATVGQYVDYLQEMGLEKPERFAGEVDDQQPLTDLEQGSAERFATWTMARLPGESEWAKARADLDLHPYPWDGPKPRSEAPIHLARDWLENSEELDEAEKKKKQLIGERIEQLRADVADLYEDVSTYVSGEKSALQEKWRTLRTEIFAGVERQKQIVETAALIEHGRRLEEILERQIQNEKFPLRTIGMHEDKTQEDFQELVTAYRDHLKELRETNHEIKSDIVEDNRGLSEEVRELKRLIEKRTAEKMKTPDTLGTDQPDPPDQFDDLNAATETRDALIRFRDSVRKASAEMKKAYSDLQTRVSDHIRPFLDAEEAPDELWQQVRAEIESREKTISRWSEAIETEFEQEPQLFNGLRETKRVRARSEALRHEIKLLESIAGMMQQDEARQESL